MRARHLTAIEVPLSVLALILLLLGLLLLLVGCVSPSGLRDYTASEPAVVGTAIADAVVGKLTGELVSVKGALNEVNATLAELHAKRLEAGEDPDEPISWGEWLAIIEALVLGGIGAKTVRDRRIRRGT